MSDDEKLKKQLDAIIRAWKNNCLDILEYASTPAMYETVFTKESCLLVDEMHKQICKARAEVIEEIKQSVLEVIEERTSAGLDDMEGADYKEFLQAEFFVIAMGIVKNEVIKVLTKLSEGDK